MPLEATKSPHSSTKAFFWRGRSYAFMAHDGGGQYDRAIQDYDQSIRLNPNDALVFYARGRVYMLMGQQDRAMQDFNQYYSIAGGP
jgi:tetratricopeptide (TPR) repeat protein